MGETVTLPDPEMSNLAEIESAIKEAQGGMNEKEKLASFIVAEVGPNMWRRFRNKHLQDIGFL